MIDLILNENVRIMQNNTNNNKIHSSLDNMFVIEKYFYDF